MRTTNDRSPNPGFASERLQKGDKRQKICDKQQKNELKDNDKRLKNEDECQITGPQDKKMNKNFSINNSNRHKLSEHCNNQPLKMTTIAPHNR
eukprot:Gb_13420 [translate_table: standard]